jgi:hypothetical protein
MIRPGEYDNIFAPTWNCHPLLIWSHGRYASALLPMPKFKEGNKSCQNINDFEITN